MTYPAICLHVGSEYKFIFPADIISVKSEGSYSHIQLKDNKQITLSKKIKDIEAILPSELFYRVHHSHLINLLYINTIEDKDKSTIILNDGTAIPISRRKKADFMNQFIQL